MTACVMQLQLHYFLYLSLGVTAVCVFLGAAYAWFVLANDPRPALMKCQAWLYAICITIAVFLGQFLSWTGLIVALVLHRLFCGPASVL